MRMFQINSVTLIPYRSAIAKQAIVNALPQQSNVQEGQFAMQVEHARVNIQNPINIGHKPKQNYCII